MNAIEKQEIETMLSELVLVPGLECDGFTRMAFTLLHKNAVHSTAYIGRLLLDEDAIIPLHFWLECGPFLIDYKARMWLGENAEVPHGVMLKADVGHLYDGEAVDMQPLPDYLYRAMMM